MVNNEHLARLGEGVEAWNAWRRENPDIRPDLGSVNFGGAILAGAKLSDANLSDAKLRDADLKQADLDKADLREADLSGADLRQATLNGAYLYRADLIGAKLEGARLGEANLIDATLIGADLTGADLSGADLRQTNLMNANLRGVTGLDCDALKRAMHWQMATRSGDLDCGEPRRPHDEAFQTAAIPVANPPTEAAVKSHYRIKIGPDGRPAMTFDPSRPGRRRPDVSRAQQRAAAADLEGGIRDLTAAVRQALAGLTAAKAQPGSERNQPPPDIAEIIEQVAADAETLILQATAPAPDLTQFHRFKTLVRDLEPIIKGASLEGGPAVTSGAIGKLESYLALFRT